MGTGGYATTTRPARRLNFWITASIISAALMLAACDSGANGEFADAVEIDADMVAKFDALEGIDGRPTQKTAVAIEELVALGDSAVPALHAKLVELGGRIDEIKVDQRLDDRGLPSYAHLDAEAARQQKTEWATVNVVQGHIIRILQRIDTRAAKRALHSYFDSRELVSDPVATAAESESTPAQLWTALERMLWCGNYDAKTQQVARERMSADQNRRVRALAAHLAARAGMEQEALPVLMEMVKSPQSGPDGRDLHVLLGLAHLKDADEVNRIAAMRPFRPDDVELAEHVARFEHADEQGRYALMRELKSSTAQQNPILDIVFVGHILREDRMDWLREFAYVRRGLPSNYAVSEQSARLFAVLGYDVSLDGDEISAKRLACSSP